MYHLVEQLTDACSGKRWDKALIVSLLCRIESEVDNYHHVDSCDHDSCRDDMVSQDDYDRLEQKLDEQDNDLQHAHDRTTQLEDLLSKGNIRFPSKYRTWAELKRFKVIPGGL